MPKVKASQESRYKVMVNAQPFEPPFLLVENGLVVQSAFQFLMLIYLRDFSPQTVRAYAYDLLAFYRFLDEGTLKIEDLNAQHLAKFILSQRKQNAAARTINRRLTVLKSFLNSQYNGSGDRVFPSPSPVLYKGRKNTALLGNSYIKGSKTWKLKIPHCMIVPLSDHKIHRFLSRIKRYRDLAIIYLILFCGLRSREVMLLEIDNIDFIESHIRIRGKGNRERMLPISKLVSRAMKSYLDYERPEHCDHNKCFVTLQGPTRGRPLTIEALRMIFRHRRESLRLKELHPHLLRHTFCTQLLTQGAPLPVVQKLMGHSDIQTTMAYTHIASSDVSKEYHKAMEELQKHYDNETHQG